MARSSTTRRRCVEVVEDERCDRQFRPPLRDPDADRCSEHRRAVVLEVPRRSAPVEGAMVAAVRAELERCRAVGSLGGAIALRLALSLDDPDLAASSVASLSAQLVRTLEPLQRAAPRELDDLDELAAEVAQIRGVR
jgi:hypothetical protein